MAYKVGAIIEMKASKAERLINEGFAKQLEVEETKELKLKDKKTK